MQDVINALKKSEVALFPCDTIWGILGLMNTQSAEKIRQIKGRSAQTPFLLLIPHLDHLYQLIESLDPKYQPLLEEFWPGPVTFVFKKSARVPETITGGLNTVAIRYPLFDPLSQLLMGLDQPLISTSANLSHQKMPESQVFEALDPAVVSGCDVVYNQATPSEKQASSIIDLTQDQPKFLRKGAFAQEIAHIISKYP